MLCTETGGSLLGNRTNSVADMVVHGSAPSEGLFVKELVQARTCHAALLNKIKLHARFSVLIAWVFMPFWASLRHTLLFCDFWCVLLCCMVVFGMLSLSCTE